MVKPVFLSPLVDQLTGFGQVYTIAELQHILTSYGAIDKIDLKENAVKNDGYLQPHGTSSMTDQTVV